MVMNYPEIEPLLAQHSARNAIYAVFLDYYEGRHKTNFASAKWRNAFGNLFRQFSDNLCAPIVDAASDRLRIASFQHENDETARQIQEIWRKNRMETKSGAVHEHALKVGDAYVIVWPSVGLGVPAITPNPAHQIAVIYNDDDQSSIAVASKLWQVPSGEWRLTLYTPSTIAKFISNSKNKSMPDKASTFIPYQPVGDLMWPIPNPTGRVPVFHFANNPEMGLWGQSELWNVIKLQDALNKSIADMLVAMEYMALPQRWATGLEIETDENGNPIIPFKAGADQIISNDNDAGRFGQFEQANLQNFVQVQNDIRLEMARISRTPLHYLSLGGSSQNSFVSVAYPSGESQKTAEEPFVAKIRDRQSLFGDVWEDVMAFAVQLMNANQTKLQPDEIETIWVKPEPRSENDDIDNAVAKVSTLQIPIETVWAELGYTPSQIDQMKKERDANGSQMDQQSNQASGGFNSQSQTRRSQRQQV